MLTDASPERLAHLYRSMLRIRRVEERVAAIYHTDKIKSPVHLSIGQEPPSVGVCEALAPQDVVFGTYRGHALYLAKGGDLRGMVAELYGKVTGCGRGKAGSMHLGDRSVGMMGTSAVVATSIPHAVGYAWAERTRKRDTVVAVFFGDGAVEEGVFPESLNFAALKNAPVLFVCENNLYAIHTPIHVRTPKPNYCERAEAHGIPAERIPGNDVLATAGAAKRAVDSIRLGGGPRFLEVETYRWREHVGPGEDWHLGYRSRAEGDSWVERDEIVRIGAMLDPDRRASIDASVDDEIEDAFAFAEAREFPRDEELYQHVFQP
ncbi:MAG: acetoin dehydrogenase [Rhodospirillales bacterium]|nr:acetoin dehydrogenase [Rhodospirillales bacterium]